MEAARRLLRCGQHATCVTVCEDAIRKAPDNSILRLLKARALMELRKSEDAKRELALFLRRHPDSGEAHRLLGELAIRDGKMAAAMALLRQAIRLSPTDQRARSLLGSVETSQPTVAVEKLPAATATVGCTYPPFDGEATVEQLAPNPADPMLPTEDYESLAVEGFGDEVDPLRIGDITERNVVRGRAVFAVGSQFERPPTGTPTDKFGRYLVNIGALTPLQLKACLDYHRINRVKVGAAAVALGFASEPSVEWAAHDYHIARSTA